MQPVTGLKRFSHVRVPPLIIAVALAAGCGESNPAADDRRALSSDGPASRPVGERERRAAAALSVYAADPRFNDLDPYDRALECAASTAAIVRWLSQTPVVGTAEMQEFDRLHDILRARLMRAGSSGGRTPEKANADLARARADAEQDLNRSAKTTLACIRELGGDAVPAQGAPI